MDSRLSASSLSMGFSRQEYWSGLPFPSPGDVPDQRSNSGLVHCRQILYHLNHQKNPNGDQWACFALSLSESLKSSKGHPWWASPCPRPVGSSPFLPGLLNVAGAFPALTTMMAYYGLTTPAHCRKSLKLPLWMSQSLQCKLLNEETVHTCFSSCSLGRS